MRNILHVSCFFVCLRDKIDSTFLLRLALARTAFCIIHYIALEKKTDSETSESIRKAYKKKSTKIVTIWRHEISLKAFYMSHSEIFNNGEGAENVCLKGKAEEVLRKIAAKNFHKRGNETKQKIISKQL